MASKMAWSKSTRIKVMIAIDTAFFLLELICGFLAHSLALTADAFHMLNDIISLAIGLWAVVAAQKATTDEFTFGWVRAEILGAFFNAVFLIALCVSIILEALTRFVEPPEINQPKLILIVGCAGLVSNLLEVIAQRAVESPETARRIRFGDDTAARDDSTSQSRATPQARGRGKRRSNAPIGDLETDVNEESPLLVGDGKGNNGTINHSHSHSHSVSHKRPRRDSSVHDGHNHTLPRKAGAKASGHNHADMGMNAMMLHVLGDALGNVGVIITALVIWLTDWPGKLYCDPAVSLLITAIILKTSIPLTRATARVLLQATPENICIQDIRQDIEGLPGVVSCHHIHVWQLSDTKVVASMHLQVAFPINEHSGEKYMQLAKRARKCLHGYGIHSATIQPEFCLDQQHRHAGDAAALRMDGGLDGTGENACLLDCIDDCRGQGCCPSGDASSKASSTRRGSDSIHGGDGH
ncbi:Cobalt uptake protein COT1 [Metarhizium anisopliae]